MAGKPKTMLKRVAALEEAAFELARGVCAARPRQYAARDGKEGEDEHSRWWNEACRAVEMAAIAVGILLGRIEERAGLDWESLQREREQRRGLVPEDTTEAEVEAAPTQVGAT